MSLIDNARDKLLAYCSLTNEKYKTPSHLIQMAKILEAVERGDLKRVIITIPPRHGKSMLCSTYFPAWYIGRNPTKYLITATYGQDLSDDFGRKVRDQLNEPVFKATFPECQLRSDSKAAARFATTKDGTYFGVGSMGALTGRGADLFLIDDPIKNREEADSELMRTKLYDWFRSVAYTRLMPGGAIVVIMTRWNQEDLVGQILANENASDWTKFDLKAINDEGEPLWPEAYNLDALNDIRRTVGEYDWQCLYQQDPIPAEGVIVHPDWMRYGKQVDGDGYSAIMIGVDPAMGLKTIHDETAICVGGLGFGENAPIDEIETVHGHWTKDEAIKIIKALYVKHKADMVGVEDVQAQTWLVQDLVKEGLNVAPIKTGGKDKVVRLMSVSHFMTRGRVSIQTKDLREQCLRFRGGSEKNDLVDAFVNMLIMIRDYTIERTIDRRNEDLKAMDPISAQIWGMERAYKNAVDNSGSWGVQEEHFNIHQLES